LLVAASSACLAQPQFNWNPKWTAPVKAGNNNAQGMAYDPVHNVTVVFDTQGLTWEWSATARVFTQQFPAHIPTVRTGESMAWDPVNQQILMYGGYSGSAALNDTWLYNAGIHDWAMLAPSTTPTGATGGNANVTGRTDYGMVTDTGTNQVVIFRRMERLDRRHESLRPQRHVGVERKYLGGVGGRERSFGAV